MCLALMVLSCSTVLAQKKKDLLLEIEDLKSELRDTQANLSASQQSEKASLAGAEAANKQVNELRDANAALLKNLNSFAEVSSKNSETVAKALKSLEQKENQLKVVTDALSRNDSIVLVTLATFKNALGGNAKTSVKSGTVIITLPNDYLFGDNDKNYAVKDEATSVLSAVAKTLNANPELNIIIEGNSNALEFKNGKILDNWDLSSLQAAAVARVLQANSLDPKRMKVLGRSEYASQSVVETSTFIIIDPKYDAFYTLVKDSMKQNGKN